MALLRFAFATIVLLGTALAQPAKIDHDKVQPFPQPDPVTVSDKAAVKFKPQVSIAFGCHPYPAVQADGAVSGGLNYSGKPRGGCKGSKLGSQIYARSTWHRGIWAIMYAWYLPKGYERVDARSVVGGHRHFWGHATVWIDNPALENAQILGASMSGQGTYNILAPVEPKFLEGSSLKLKFDAYVLDFAQGRQGLSCVEETGESQDLITWGQLTEKARNTLNTYEFYPYVGEMGIVPLKDEVFNGLLNATWPFSSASA
ncbi:Necrosis inducing protein [Phytophthora cactorum]|nr:Necrosis inducing protein [Phytophthora cactorum]